jgi:hypothetical protein
VESYRELRGAQITGWAEIVEERAEVQRRGEAIWARCAGTASGELTDATRQMIAADDRDVSGQADRRRGVPHRDRFV